MGIRQFNASYIKQEDRIMFRFNTHDGSEYRLWLTRLISMSLLSTIRKIIHIDLEKKHSPRVAQVIQEFQEDGVKKTMNTKDPFKTADKVSLKLPLGSDPILVTGFNITKKDVQFSIDFKLVGHKKINLTLPLTAVQSVIAILEQMEQKALWTSASLDAPIPSNVQASEEAKATTSNSKKLH